MGIFKHKTTIILLLASVCFVTSHFWNERDLHTQQMAAGQFARVANLTHDVRDRNLVARLYRTSLYRVRDGGVVRGAESLLTPEKDPRIKATIEQILKLIDQQQFTEARRQFHGLAKQLQSRATARAANAHLLRTLVFSIGILLILVYFYLMRRAQQEQSDALVAETNIRQELLGAIPDAAIVLDSDLAIVEGDRESVGRLFDKSSETSQFTRFVHDLLDPLEYEQLHDQMTSIILGTRDQAIEGRLTKVLELSDMSADGELHHRHIALTIDPLSSANEHEPLGLVVLRDVTHEMREIQSAEIRKHSQAQQNKVLLSMLHLSAKRLVECGHRVTQLLQDVDTQKNSEVERLRDRKHWVQDVQRLARQVEMDARHFGLSSIQQSWAALAESLDDQKNNDTLSDQDFTSIKYELSTLRPELALVKSMAPILLSARSKGNDEHDVIHNIRGGFIDHASHQLEDAYASFNESYTVPYELVDQSNEESINALSREVDLLNVWEGLAKAYSTRFDRPVKLNASGLNAVNHYRQYHQELLKVGSALIANSIEHGIESANTRLEARKDKVARIDIDLVVKPTVLELSIRDDGRGLDFANIRKHAIHQGLLTEEHPQDDRASYLRCLFEPNFSTRDGGAPAVKGKASQSTMGLDQVRALLKDLGGKVSVRSIDREYCQFRITIPRAPH